MGITTPRRILGFSRISFLLYFIERLIVNSFCLSRSVDFTKLSQRPDAEENSSDDLLLRHASHRRVPAVNRGCAVVAHHKIPAVRYLIGQFNITVAKIAFGQIWL